jgi:hypothetical protein
LKGRGQAGYWHVIGDGPDLMARLPRQAHFVTILSYRATPDGVPAQYRGSLYWEYDAADPAHTLEELRRCVAWLEVEYGCPLEAVRVWHSGRRGFHVTMPATVIGAQAGHPLLPRIYAAMIGQLFPAHLASNLDRSIYSMGKGRMWRLPNRRRLDNGRYKVPLSLREVLHNSYADLEALTRRPRKGVFWPSDEELTPCPGLVQLYQETTAAVEQATSRLFPHMYQGSETGGDVDVLLGRCAFIRHCRDDTATLTEPQWYAMISNIARCTNGPAAVHQLSTPYPQYSREETDAKIAHALQDTGPHTCAFIQAEGFLGCPPGGCGVKAPISLGGTAASRRLPSGLQVRPVAATACRIRTIPAQEVVKWRA